MHGLHREYTMCLYIFTCTLSLKDMILTYKKIVSNKSLTHSLVCLHSKNDTPLVFHYYWLFFNTDLNHSCLLTLLFSLLSSLRIKWTLVFTLISFVSTTNKIFKKQDKGNDARKQGTLSLCLHLIMLEIRNTWFVVTLKEC